jgi:peptidyl-prolyl cis-trans isomerase D
MDILSERGCKSMLDFMRRHAQSWMIKVALGAVVVVFVFWGIWTPEDGREREFAKIGDQIITVEEARKYYFNLRERYQMAYGAGFTEEMAQKLGLKEQAVKDLIHRALLLREAKRLGLRVTPEEIQSSLEAVPAFQRDGIFDKATYQRAVQRAGMTLPAFEAGQEQMLLIGKLQSLIVSSAKISDREILDAYRNDFEKINLEAAFLDPEQVKGVSPSAEEVQDYFSKNREKFKIPATARARYLLFDPKNYLQGLEPTAGEIANYYEANTEKFTQPKRINVRHILLRADPKDAEGAAMARKKAESIREEAAGGKDFSALARQHSEDPGTKDRGGELGFISKGQVIPEFEEAAFGLKAGEISPVIQTAFGLHILKVDEIQEQKTDPLEKAKDQIRTLLQTRKAREIAHDEADQAYGAAVKDRTLEKFAREKNLALKETGLVSAADKTDLDPKLKDAALSLGKSEVSPVLRIGETFAVLQVVEKQEARNPDLKEVEAGVIAAARREKQKELAAAKAGELLEKLRAGADWKPLMAREGLKTEETGFFERALDPPKIGSSEDLRRAVQAAGLQNPFPQKPVFVDGKYVLFRFKEKKEIDPQQFESQKENFRLGLLQQKQERVFAGWVDSLLEKAKAEGQFKMFQEAKEIL